MTDGNSSMEEICEYYADHQHLRCRVCGFKHIMGPAFFDDYEYLRRFAEYWGDMHGLKPLYAFLEKPWHYVNELPGFFEHTHIELNNEEQY